VACHLCLVPAYQLKEVLLEMGSPTRSLFSDMVHAPASA
jgi:hypothetical protein